MRLRLIKSHVTQIVLSGTLVYMIIFLISDTKPQERTLAMRYKEYQRIMEKESKEKSAKRSPESDRVDKLALKMVEKMKEAERLRFVDKRTEDDNIPRLPGDMLDTILAQVPGGRDAIARGDDAAINTLQSLVKKFKKDYSKSMLSQSGLADKFASQMFEGQKMLGPLPDVRNEPRFFDPARLPPETAESHDVTEELMARLIKAFPNLKGNTEAQDTIMQRLQEANPQVIQILKNLQNGGQNQIPLLDPNNFKSDDLINMLSNFENSKNQQSKNALANSLQPNFQNGGNFKSNFQQQGLSGNQYLNLPLQNSESANGQKPLLGEPYKSDKKLGGSAAVAVLQPGNPVDAAKQLNKFIQTDQSGTNMAGNKIELPNFDFNFEGGINLHELLQMKELLKQGITVKELKKRLKLGPPQMVGESSQINGQQQIATIENGQKVEVGKAPKGDPSNDNQPHQKEMLDGVNNAAQGGLENLAQVDEHKNPANEEQFPPFADNVIDSKSDGQGHVVALKDPQKDDVNGNPNDTGYNIPKEEKSEVRKSQLLKERVKGEKEKSNTLPPQLTFMSAQEYDEMVKKQRSGVTDMPAVDFAKVRIAVVEIGDVTGLIDNVTKIMTIDEYKYWKKKQFIKQYANPAEISGVKPTLMSYGPDLAKPNPRSLIKDLSLTVQEKEIEESLIIDRKRRSAFGDDDISTIPEVKAEMQNNPDSIPNIIHFIWFSCHRFRVHHFLSMKSALEVQIPSLILFHTNCTPSGMYFEEFQKMAGPKLKIVKRTPPTHIWGTQIEKVEHQSDVARLQILLEVGGIYMDDDMIILKPLNELMNNSIVLGEENYDALANSIVMSNKNAWFLKRWYQEYKAFNGSKWSHSSCFVPWSMWMLFPSTIHVVKEKMLRPNWEEIKYIYHELWDWTNNYSVHLYSRFMNALDGTPERTLTELAILNTTYGEIARYILWGDQTTRDITDWL